jgi:NitT/TauT family transport system substrate-binding protein
LICPFGRRRLSCAPRCLLSLLVILLVGLCACRPEANHNIVKYGITPYQDSALPVVADTLGWYRDAGISAQMVAATWGDVVTGISSGAIDVAVYNFNSFQAPYENAANGPRKPVFYCPLFLFKGQAIMIKAGSSMVPFKDVPGEDAATRDRRVADAARQLKGKRVAVTVGTELDQIVITALQKAGLGSKKDVTLINASPEDSLAAFLSGNVDAFAAGLTDRHMHEWPNCDRSATTEHACHEWLQNGCLLRTSLRNPVPS